MDPQHRHARGPHALDPDAARALDQALDHARRVLPAQSPIGSFVHHNTLHAFQHLPFHEAVRAACALHDARGYLSEAAYRAAIAAGRVQPLDLAHALSLREREVGDEMLGPHARLALEARVLANGLAAADDLPARAPGLWEACRELAPLDPLPRADLLGRVGRDRTMRDLLCALDARDPNELTNPVLIDFLGAYLDAGMARWAMPGRERGVLASFVTSARSVPASLPAFQRRAVDRLVAARARGTGPRALSLALLSELGVSVADYPDYVSRTLLELPGWTGMLARLEQFPAERHEGCPPLSLRELLAIRLALDVEAYAECARALGHAGRLVDFGAFAARRLCAQPVDNTESARRLLQLCALAEIDEAALRGLGASFAESACAMLDELSVELPRLLHEAYEHAHLREVLDGIHGHRAAGLEAPVASPRFQLLFCIDDREESTRRYVEEAEPRAVTYGVAGFFGVAMRFRGIDDHSPASLCPVVVEPAHAVEETALDAHEAALRARRARRSRAAQLRWEAGDASRSFVRGLALTPLVGLVAALPLTLRVLFPRLAARLHRWLVGRAVPAPRTALTLARDEGAALPRAGELPRGFTVDEQAERVAGTLENVGLVGDFAPLVAVFGHGATTVNNPHHSAYDCGACGGRSGGPNARAFAAMANARPVRDALRARGIDIPDSTWFVGGLHDTTTDALSLFDLELAPASHRADLHALRALLDQARAQAALERCRKFEHAPPDLTAAEALRHVEERAADLSQARPELGHATNAVCIVGGRRLSRGLFLDRRSFLASYRAEIDPDLKILERILGAVVPVGANINLEYYFSTVDNEVWGCGTKLPHNLSGLLGVMEGASGDLRTGLPRQMVEVHDPVRLLGVVEATPEAILEVAARKPEVAELVTRGWVRLASVHPETGDIQVFDGGAFRPYAPGPDALPSVGSAREWYRGRLGFLAPVRILKGRHEAA